MTKEIYQQVQLRLKEQGIDLPLEKIAEIDKFRWEWVARQMKTADYPSILMHNWGRFILQKKRLNLLSTGKYQSPEKQEQYKQMIQKLTDYKTNFKKCTSKEITSPQEETP